MLLTHIEDQISELRLDYTDSLVQANLDSNPSHLLLRRLHKVLTLPVKDLRDSTVTQEKLDEALKKDPKGKRKIYKGFYSILRKTLYS